MPSASPTRGVLSASTLPALYADPDVFPLLPGVGFPEKTPNFSSSITRSYSGREVSLQAWSAPLWTWKFSYEVVRDKPANSLPELGSLFSFFCTRAGKYGFLFYRDPYDCTVTNQQIGTGDGSTTAFQLIRTVGFGTPYAYVEPVYAVMSGGAVYVNGSSVSNFSISPWGIITFASAPASGAVITYSATFLFVCRFDQDNLDMTQFGSQYWSNDGITLTSKRP